MLDGEVPRGSPAPTHQAWPPALSRGGVRIVRHARTPGRLRWLSAGCQSGRLDVRTHQLIQTHGQLRPPRAPGPQGAVLAVVDPGVLVGAVERVAAGRCRHGTGLRGGTLGPGLGSGLPRGPGGWRPLHVHPPVKGIREPLLPRLAGALSLVLCATGTGMGPMRGSRGAWVPGPADPRGPQCPLCTGLWPARRPRGLGGRHHHVPRGVRLHTPCRPEGGPGSPGRVAFANDVVSVGGGPATPWRRGPPHTERGADPLHVSPEMRLRVRTFDALATRHRGAGSGLVVATAAGTGTSGAPARQRPSGPAASAESEPRALRALRAGRQRYGRRGPRARGPRGLA